MVCTVWRAQSSSMRGFQPELFNSSSREIQAQTLGASAVDWIGLSDKQSSPESQFKTTHDFPPHLGVYQ
eukprot:1674343-Amphidinium_carterae.1